MTNLIEHARTGNLKGLKEELARKDTDVSATEPDTGFTALHAATAWQNNACVHQLLEDGRIDPHKKDASGRRAIDVAQARSLSLLIEATYAGSRQKAGASRATTLSETSLLKHAKRDQARSR